MLGKMGQWGTLPTLATPAHIRPPKGVVSLDPDSAVLALGPLEDSRNSAASTHDCLVQPGELHLLSQELNEAPEGASSQELGTGMGRPHTRAELTAPGSWCKAGTRLQWSLCDQPEELQVPEAGWNLPAPSSLL